MVKMISMREVELVAHALAKRLLQWDEPIPDFETRYRHTLESCIAVPFQTFARQQLYKGLTGKAAILFYVMIKNHPFQNGNKRISTTTTLYFLYKNKKWIKADNQKLYNFAKWVAASELEVKDQTVAAVEEFLKKYMVDLDVAHNE